MRGSTSTLPEINACRRFQSGHKPPAREWSDGYPAAARSGVRPRTAIRFVKHSTYSCSS